MMRINLHKALNGTQGAFTLDTDFSIAQGSIVALFGPSGAGKTTLLKCIAGLETANGTIAYNTKKWLDSSSGINVPVQKRNIGFLFQDYTVFPNLTVGEHFAFAQGKTPDKALEQELCSLMELAPLWKQKPVHLSGGQKQRLALAMNVLRKPELLLLDEPFTSLDFAMKTKLQSLLLQLHAKFNFTIILVTHQIEEVMQMATEVIVLEQGQVVKRGAPELVFTAQKVSGRFKLTGTIVEINKNQAVAVLTVLTESSTIKAVVSLTELENLALGDLVLVTSKAFNPVVQKIMG